MYLKRVVFLGMCIALSLGSCKKSDTSIQIASDGTVKIQIVVTINAIKEITAFIGGEHVSISTLIPDGMEPHNFEPRARDMAVLSHAKVMVYNGMGLETWLPDVLAAVQNQNLTVVDASNGVVPIIQDGIDPHVWLSVIGAMVQSENIGNALITVDPAHADYYRQRTKDYIVSLESLYKEYDEKLASVSRRTIVTGHAAFAYLCRDFTLTQNSVEDVFASGEPNAQRLVELVLYARENKVKTIFVEKMVNPAISRTLADEVGAKVQTIYTLESQEDGKTGLERMRANLEVIYLSLAE